MEAAEPTLLPQLHLSKGLREANQFRSRLCKSCRRHTGRSRAPLSSSSRSASLSASHLIQLTHLCNRLMACKKPQISSEGGAGSGAAMPEP